MTKESLGSRQGDIYFDINMARKWGQSNGLTMVGESVNGMDSVGTMGGMETMGGVGNTVDGTVGNSVVGGVNGGMGNTMDGGVSHTVGGAVVGLARVGDISDVAGVVIGNIVGHGLDAAVGKGDMVLAVGGIAVTGLGGAKVHTRVVIGNSVSVVVVGGGVGVVVGVSVAVNGGGMVGGAVGGGVVDGSVGSVDRGMVGQSMGGSMVDETVAEAMGSVSKTMGTMSKTVHTMAKAVCETMGGEVVGGGRGHGDKGSESGVGLEKGEKG